MAFILGMQDWFNIGKFTIFTDDDRKEKLYDDLKGYKKSFYIVQYVFVTKTFGKLGIDRTSQCDKGPLQNTTASIFNGKNLIPSSFPTLPK